MLQIITLWQFVSRQLTPIFNTSYHNQCYTNIYTHVLGYTENVILK